MSRRPPVRFVPCGAARPMSQGSLALAPQPHPAPARAGLWAVRAEDARPDAELRPVAESLTRLVVEVLAGTRPLHQLARRASPEVCRGLAGFRPPVRPGRRTPPPRVLAFWMQEPAPGVAETGAVALLAGRVQALAVRLEPHRGRWRCTALETTVRPA